MIDYYECGECRTQTALPLRRSGIKTVTCRRCGDVRFVNDGKLGERMYPSLHMLPVDHIPHDGCGALSKWMPTHTRPVVVGDYHVRFRHLDPSVLIARWDGKHFVAAAGQRVSMTNFLTWRGLLA